MCHKATFPSFLIMHQKMKVVHIRSKDKENSEKDFSKIETNFAEGK